MTVVFRGETDLAEWNASYRDGLVPDLFPYGLHRLADAGFDVRWSSPAAISASQKLRLVVAPPARHSSPDWTVAWDEYTSLRMLRDAPATRRGGGVIWATDALARGGGEAGRARSLLRSLRTLDLVWVLSTAQLGPLRDAFGARGPAIEYLPFGIAADYFTDSPLPEAPAVLSIGTDRDRDHATLVRAFERVHRERPEVRLGAQVPDGVAVPDGVERVPRMSHAALRDRYAETTVVALATRPNLHVSGMTTALEAMSSGRPIVMTRTPGIDEYVSEATGGALADPGDDAALAAAILARLAPGAAAEAGALGRAAVEARFTTRRMATRLGELLSR